MEKNQGSFGVVLSILFALEIAIYVICSYAGLSQMMCYVIAILFFVLLFALLTVLVVRSKNSDD